MLDNIFKIVREFFTGKPIEQQSKVDIKPAESAVNSQITDAVTQASAKEDDTLKKRVEEITKLYQDLLKRDPDQAGLDYWMSTSHSIDTIKAELMKSNEYVAALNTVSVKKSAVKKMTAKSEPKPAAKKASAKKPAAKKPTAKKPAAKK